jgi:MoaA/NifB/PqqE/SkfB family radical SAM enzyme
MPWIGSCYWNNSGCSDFVSIRGEFVVSNLTEWAEVDGQGRLILPAETMERYGIEPGGRLRLDESKNIIRLHRPVTNLAKVYIETTNLCNLACRTCMRHSWDETLGQMSADTFEKVLDGIREFSNPPTVFFGGLGEPLFHPFTIEWVSKAKALGARVEMITNGTLLTEERSRALVDAGLDVLWVSIDGATPESYTDVRLGAELPNVLENLQRLRPMRKGFYQPTPVIGVVFVAMKRNINDLPKVIALGKSFGARRFMVTNVLPYTEEMQNEVVYSRSLRNITYLPSPSLPSLSLPKMDIDDTTREAFLQAMNSGCSIELAGQNLGAGNDVCTFIESGSVTIGWDGNLSPCPPLLHNHVSYLHGKIRRSRKHVVGNVNERSLHELWSDPEYVAYRERVQGFAFAPCTPCGGCDLSESNEEDCFGNTFPSCGGCLWNQAVIQCP